MTEPVYQFVKGTGWVISSENSMPFTFQCGTRCLLVDRLPKVGEVYRSAPNHENSEFVKGKFVVKGKPDLYYWAAYLNSSVTFRHSPILRDELTRHDLIGSYYVTVVPL